MMGASPSEGSSSNSTLGAAIRSRNRQHLLLAPRQQACHLIAPLLEFREETEHPFDGSVQAASLRLQVNGALKMRNKQLQACFSVLIKQSVRLQAATANAASLVALRSRFV